MTESADSAETAAAWLGAFWKLLERFPQNPADYADEGCELPTVAAMLGTTLLASILDCADAAPPDSVVATPNGGIVWRFGGGCELEIDERGRPDLRIFDEDGKLNYRVNSTELATELAALSAVRAAARYRGSRAGDNSEGGDRDDVDSAKDRHNGQ